MGPALALRGQRVAERADLGEAAADDEQRVRPFEPLADDRRAAVAGHAEVERVIVGDDVAATPAGDDRDVEQLRELEQIRRGPGPQHAGTREDHGPLGRGDELEDRPDVVRLGPWRRRTRRVELGSLRQDLVEEILGERQQDGSRPPDERRPDGVADCRRDVGGRAWLRRVHREAAERALLVGLLERLAADEVAFDLADEREHRCRVLARRVDADREVRRADGPRADARRRSAGQLAVGLGHERGGALVASRDDADARLVEPLEQAEEALAGHGEGVPDADRSEGVRDEAADGPSRGGVAGAAVRRAPERARWARPAQVRRPASADGASSGVSGVGRGRLGLHGRRAPRAPRLGPPARAPPRARACGSGSSTGASDGSAGSLGSTA